MEGRVMGVLGLGELKGSDPGLEVIYLLLIVAGAIASAVVVLWRNR
jgi:hypothetical protein